jgi:hypothetical protein
MTHLCRTIKKLYKLHNRDFLAEEAVDHTGKVKMLAESAAAQLPTVVRRVGTAGALSPRL